MDNENNLYGVDLNKSVTPIMARDAMVLCFVKAHCVDTGLGDENSESVKNYVKNIVVKAFKDTESDFENPDKQSILKVMENLKNFAVNFRDQTIIQKHYEEMMRIVEKID